MTFRRYLMKRFIEFICLAFALLFFANICNGQTTENTTTTSSNPANLPDADCVGCGSSAVFEVPDSCCMKYNLMWNADSTCMRLVADLVVVDSLCFEQPKELCQPESRVSVTEPDANGISQVTITNINCVPGECSVICFDAQEPEQGSSIRHECIVSTVGSTFATYESDTYA